MFCFCQKSVNAQSQALIESSKPDISSYPDLSVLFRIFESSGAFVKNLDIASVHIIENNQIIAPDSLEMLETHRERVLQACRAAPEAALVDMLDASGTVLSSLSASTDLLNEYFALPDGCKRLRISGELAFAVSELGVYSSETPPDSLCRDC